MPSRVVKQPDGKFAIFSTVVDDFTAAGLTREQAVAYWRNGDMNHLSEADAERKVENAEKDVCEAAATDPRADGLRRWRECLATITAIHGKKHCREMVDEVLGR